MREDHLRRLTRKLGLKHVPVQRAAVFIENPPHRREVERLRVAKGAVHVE